MNKKILIIQPTYRLMDGKLIKEFPLFNYSYNLPILSACIPADWKKECCLEYIDDIDYNSDASIIIITSAAYDIQHAVEIISNFRKKDKFIIYGCHMDELSDQIIRRLCDSIFYGFPTPQKMKDMIADFINEKPKKEYHFGYNINYPFDYNVFQNKKMLFLPMIASLGCRYKCAYCCYPPIYNGHYHLRKIEYVISDLNQCMKINRPVAFLDANLFNNSKYLNLLCNRIIEEKISIIWGAQCTVNIGNDTKLLNLMYKAGCRMLFLGLESLNSKNMHQLNKPLDVNLYDRQLSNIHSAKISIGAFFMLGMDDDDESIFERVYSFFQKNNIEVPYVHIYVPIPGTKLAEQLKSKNRIASKYFDEYSKNRSKFSVPCSIAYFTPNYLTKEKLETGFLELFKKLTRVKNIIRRIRFSNFTIALVILKMNLESRKKYKSMVNKTFQSNNLN